MRAGGRPWEPASRPRRPLQRKSQALRRDRPTGALDQGLRGDGSDGRVFFSLGDAASPAARPLTSSLLCAFFTSETTQAASERRAAVAARLAARERQPSRSLSSSSHKSRKMLTCHACGTESRLA